MMLSFLTKCAFLNKKGVETHYNIYIIKAVQRLAVCLRSLHHLPGGHVLELKPKYQTSK